MMKIIPAFTAGAALMVAGNAIAQSSDSSTDGFYVNGYSELSHFESNGFYETNERTDLDMGILPGAIGFPIGFSLGIDGYVTDIFEEYAFYPAITFGLASDLISVGVPRSVYNKGYIPDHNFGGSSFLDLEFAELSGSLLATIYLEESGFDPYGIRYDGEFANTKFGASYHQADDVVGNVDFYALAFQQKFEAASVYEMLFFGGGEYIDDSSSTNISSFELGVEAGNDHLRIGVTLGQSNFDGLISDQGSIYADYKIIDAFSVTGTFSALDFGGTSFNFCSLGLEYRFLGNGFARANYTDTDGYLSDSLYEFTVGWKF